MIILVPKTCYNLGALCPPQSQRVIWDVIVMFHDYPCSQDMLQLRSTLSPSLWVCCSSMQARWIYYWPKQSYGAYDLFSLVVKEFGLEEYQSDYFVFWDLRMEKWFLIVLFLGWWGKSHFWLDDVFATLIDLGELKYSLGIEVAHSSSAISPHKRRFMLFSH